MNSIVTAIILMPILIYIAMGIYLYLRQRSFLYFPTKPVEHTHEVEVFQNGGESIHVIVVNPNRGRALLYFGGNAEAVALGAQAFASKLTHYTTYLVEYRGYGDSSGKPTQKALLSDALHIYDMISHRHRWISLFGRSLGTGVASLVAARREIDRMALITPFDSIESVAQDRFVLYPMSILLEDTYDSIGQVPKIEADTIILIASDDKVVPPEHAQRLAEAYPSSQIETVVIDHTEHHNIADTQEYDEVLGRFFRA